jgi:hypothetical protein
MIEQQEVFTCTANCLWWNCACIPLHAAGRTAMTKDRHVKTAAKDHLQQLEQYMMLW